MLRNNRIGAAVPAATATAAAGNVGEHGAADPTSELPKPRPAAASAPRGGAPSALPPSLVVLDLSRNAIASLPAHIGSLRAIRLLDVSLNALREPAALAGLGGLEVLAIGNRFETPRCCA